MKPYNEFPDRVNFCIEIVDELGGEKDYLYKDPHYTIEDQVWEIAKECESMPNFNNIYYGIVFSELESLVNDKYPELEIEFFHNVNDIASDMSFKVKGDSNYTDITDKDEFFDKLAEIKFDRAVDYKMVAIVPVLMCFDRWLFRLSTWAEFVKVFYYLLHQTQNSCLLL